MFHLGVCTVAGDDLQFYKGAVFSVPLRNFSNEQIINFVAPASKNLSLSWCSNSAILTVVALLRDCSRTRALVMQSFCIRSRETKLSKQWVR